MSETVKICGEENISEFNPIYIAYYFFFRKEAAARCVGRFFLVRGPGGIIATSRCKVNQIIGGNLSEKRDTVKLF